MKKTYSEKLKDPRWQKKRLEVLSRDDFTCLLCGDKETELHVHHNDYESGKEPWSYELDNFRTLCSICHLYVEKAKNVGIIPLEIRKIKREEFAKVVIKSKIRDLEILTFLLHDYDNPIQYFPLVPAFSKEELKELMKMFS